MGLFRRNRADDATVEETGHVRGLRLLSATEDTPDRQRLRVEIDGPTPAVGGIELTGAPRWLRFGQPLPVRRTRKGLEVDWERASPDGELPTTSALVKPPDPGIDDRTSKAGRAQKRGDACSVEIRSAAAALLLGMETTGVDLTTTISASGLEPYALDLKRQAVPFYARHLIAPGTVVPGWVRAGRPDKVVIDWPAAAIATPGVGVLAHEVPGSDAVADAGERAVAKITQRFLPGADVAVEPTEVEGDGAVDGIDFDSWVEIEAGLVRDRIAPSEYDAYASARGAPPDAWSRISATWHQRLRGDWELGARFGAAYQAALERRK